MDNCLRTAADAPARVTMPLVLVPLETTPAASPREPRQGFSRELGVVLILSAALTMFFLYPIASNLGSVGRVDNGDGQWSIWIVSWVARTLVVDPRHVFDANIFYPHRGTLAYSENNLGAGLLAAPVYWATRNPYAAPNFVVLLAFVLSATGTYYLVRYLTGDRRAAAISAISFRVLPVRIRPSRAHSARAHRRPSVHHVGVPSARRPPVSDEGSRPGGGDGGAGALLRLLRRVRDSARGVRGLRRRGDAVAVA